MSLFTHNLLRYAISQKIDEKLPGIEIFGEEIKQNLDPPAFFIKFLEVSQTKELNNRYHRVYPCVIHYFDDKKTNNDMYDMAESLNDYLRSIEIDGRKIYGYDMRFQIVDEVLLFYVTYQTIVYDRETYEKLMTLEERVYVKNG